MGAGATVLATMERSSLQGSLAMTTSSNRDYRENRARFLEEELRKFEGRWVAFSPDGQRIVASAASIAELSTELRAAQTDLQNVVLERIEREGPEINLGAAELL